MIKRLMLILVLAVLSINIAFADPSIDSFKGKTVLGGIVELSWTVSESTNSLDHLELYKGAQLMKKFPLSGNKYSDVYNDNSVSPGQTNDYRIVVFNVNGNTIDQTLSVTVDNAAPKLTTPSTVLTNQKTISIDTDENAVCTAILGLNSTTNLTNITLLEGKEKSHPFTADFAEGSNTVSVICADVSGNEFNGTQTITVIYDVTLPSKPELQANVENGVAKLSWSASTDSSGIKGYTVYRSTTNDNVFDNVGTVTQTSFEEPIQAATHYAIGAVDNAGNEQRSDVKTLDLGQPAPAPAPTAAAVQQTQTSQQASSSGKSSYLGLFMWVIFLGVIIAGLVMYFRKKNDKFGLDSYLSRRNKMR